MKKFIFLIISFCLIFPFMACQIDSDYLDEIKAKIDTDDNPPEEETPSEEPPSEEPPSDETLPDYGFDVTLEITHAGGGEIFLSWIEPADSAYDHVEITWNPDGTTGTNVSKGTTSYTITGLTQFIEYTITAKAVSNSGVKSNGDSIFIYLPLTPIDIYCISTVSEIIAINTDTTTLSRSYILTEDVDLSQAVWTPIGFGSDFTGIFNGNLHNIINLNISNPSISGQGFFAEVSGKITNVNLTGIQVSGLDYVGGIAAKVLAGGLVKNCSVSGTVSGQEFVGGIIGEIIDGSILNCHSSVTVSGQAEIGGVAGFVNSSSTTLSSSSGPVGGTASTVGGLIGITNFGSTVTSCYSTSAVSGSISFSGGLIGVNYDTDVEQCYATGSINGGSGTEIGGLIGHCGSGSVSNCYSTGNVSGSNILGGLIGNNLVSVSNCYAAGDVPTSVATCGGLIGASTGTYSDCFYDKDVSGHVTASLIGETALTTA
ncbi:fibronectin type III domain-containing protein [Oceanispirochaeta sp.]|uniref:fibronectin type III domain-containing protein n=1 Tax=Oceanispirochaeta sp. TaxID=2035350 RepID=UPI002625E2FE|nr:fibronectin type III domain-containing protein [Oceanispirochaeta sp.]MDA3955431.1 fibronectin type III domain-containing protein [Oceanispirochaeta sp.]